MACVLPYVSLPCAYFQSLGKDFAIMMLSKVDYLHSGTCLARSKGIAERDPVIGFSSAQGLYKCISLQSEGSIASLYLYIDNISGQHTNSYPDLNALISASNIRAVHKQQRLKEWIT